MNKEDYVSLEVAKMLKEKGFDEPCLYLYRNGSLYTLSEDVILSECDDTHDDIIYPVPTLYEAQKWIRDKQDFHIEICKQSDGWYLYIYDISIESYITECTNSNSSYEEALNRGIKEALKLI